MAVATQSCMVFEKYNRISRAYEQECVRRLQRVKESDPPVTVVVHGSQPIDMYRELENQISQGTGICGILLDGLESGSIGNVLKGLICAFHACVQTCGSDENLPLLNIVRVKNTYIPLEFRSLLRNHSGYNDAKKYIASLLVC